MIAMHEDNVFKIITIMRKVTNTPFLLHMYMTKSSCEKNDALTKTVVNLCLIIANNNISQLNHHIVTHIKHVHKYLQPLKACYYIKIIMSLKHGIFLKLLNKKM